MKKNRYILLILFFWFNFLLNSQNCNSTKIKDESISKLTNDKYIQEIESFNITKIIQKKLTNPTIKKLVEVKLYKCNDTLAIFQAGNMIINDKLIDIFISNFDTIGHKLIYEASWLCKIDGHCFYGTQGKVPKQRIKSLNVLFSAHRIVTIPDSAFSDLYEPKICTTITTKNQKKKLKTSSCKVLQSQDKSRVYIYMLNGDNEAKYEVTWIIDKGKYIGRVVDNVPE